MIASKAVRRYSKALLDASEEAGCLEHIHRDFSTLRGWMENAPTFHLLVLCDCIGHKERRIQALIDLAKAADLHRMTMDFLCAMETAKELKHLSEVMNAFERGYRARSGIVRAGICSAVPLQSDQADELSTRLKQWSGAKQVVPEFSVDSDLLGGFIVRMDGQVFDYSLSGRLARLRRRLASA